MVVCHRSEFWYPVVGDMVRHGLRGIVSCRIVLYTRYNASNLGTVFVRYAAEPYGKTWHYLWYGKMWHGMERGNEYMAPEHILSLLLFHL